MRRVLVLCALFCTPAALAYEAVPVMSFAKPTAGKKYVLVMLHPFAGEAGKGLKEKYGRSGLYPADDPTKPAWLSEWKAQREYNVFASDDGVFAVRVPDGDPGYRHWRLMNNNEPIPPKRAGWEDAPALLIYKNGQHFRTLALKDVFETSRFTDRDCYLGPIVTIDSFLDADGRVSISSESNGRKQTATVAFRSGEVIERGSWSAIIGGDTPPGSEPIGEDGTQGRGWRRGFLIGLAVVGVLTAVFVGVAVLVIRAPRKRVE